MRAEILPDVSEVVEETIENRAEVKSFDQSKLKHVETQEKNPLPTVTTLEKEH